MVRISEFVVRYYIKSLTDEKLVRTIIPRAARDLKKIFGEDNQIKHLISEAEETHKEMLNDYVSDETRYNECVLEEFVDWAIIRMGLLSESAGRKLLDDIGTEYVINQMKYKLIRTFVRLLDDYYDEDGFKRK